MAKFSDVFDDVTKQATKIPKEEYLSEGKYQIIDQGQSVIAGYTNMESGLYTDVPVIVFGDHTRVLKYVDKPLFLGADGVKLIHAKNPDANVKYLYYALSNAKKIPTCKRCLLGFAFTKLVSVSKTFWLFKCKIYDFLHFL